MPKEIGWSNESYLLYQIKSLLARAGSSTMGGISSLNGLTDATQTFAVGTAGAGFSISSAGGVHTFNIPNASASAKGLLTAVDWATFNSKADNPVEQVASGSLNPNKLISVLTGPGSTVNLPTTGATPGMIKRVVYDAPPVYDFVAFTDSTKTVPANFGTSPSIGNFINKIVNHPSNPNILILGGNFATLPNGISYSNICLWDYVNQTYSVLPNTTTGSSSEINDMIVIGNDLYICGIFTTVNGVTVNRIGRYSFTTNSWSALGSGLGGGTPFSLSYSAAQNRLYVSGAFTSPSSGVAYWNLTNSTWNAIGTLGGTNLVNKVHHSDALNRTYMCGSFTSFAPAAAGFTAANNAYLTYFDWNTNTFVPVGLTSSGAVNFNNHVINFHLEGQDLYLIGQFTVARGNVPVLYTAYYNSTTNTYSQWGQGTSTFRYPPPINLPRSIVKVGNSLALLNFIVRSSNPTFSENQSVTNVFNNTQSTAYGIVWWDIGTSTNFYTKGAAPYYNDNTSTVASIFPYPNSSTDYILHGRFFNFPITSSTATILYITPLLLYRPNNAITLTAENGLNVFGFSTGFVKNGIQLVHPNQVLELNYISSINRWNVREDLTGTYAYV